MDSINIKKVKALMHSLGLKYNLKDEDIKNLLESPYEFSGKIISELDLSDADEEIINELKTNFVYMGFGKLYMNKISLIKRLNNNKINLSKKWKK